VAIYYHAADIYIHATHIDTFPTTILESLACGKPVVATAVGGYQNKSLMEKLVFWFPLAMLKQWQHV